jgi:hypothetical protein
MAENILAAGVNVAKTNPAVAVHEPRPERDAPISTCKRTPV